MKDMHRSGRTASQAAVQMLTSAAYWADVEPNVIVTEAPEAITFRVALPDVSADDIDLAFVGGVLTLRATYIQSGSGPVTGRYLRRFGLPFEAACTQISATFADETLTVRVPRENRWTVDVLPILVQCAV